MKRRHDIDALRAIAFGLLILYHACMLYVADWGWHVKSSYTTSALQWPMIFLNRWRMDLIFLISGAATAYMMRGVPGGTFLARRALRILVPLAFGMAVVIPIQPYAQGVMNGLVEPGFGRFLVHYYTGYPWPRDAFDGWEYGFTWNHLWYLPYLLLYTVAFTVLRSLCAARFGAAARRAVEGLHGWRLLVLPALPLYLYSVALQARFPATHALVGDWYNHALYFTVFAYGWWLGSVESLWDELHRLRRVSLAIALAAFAIYMAMNRLHDDSAPSRSFLLAGWAARNTYVWCIIAAVLGWARELLDRPLPWLPFANEAVYPWYVMHQSFIILLAYWLVPLRLGPVIEPTLVIGGTVALCWFFHTRVIRPVGWLRIAFGMRPLPRVTAEPAALRSPS